MQKEVIKSAWMAALGIWGRFCTEECAGQIVEICFKDSAASFLGTWERLGANFCLLRKNKVMSLI
jgi:hypothetical protein